MKRWRVFGQVSASQYMGEYEAETAEEAMIKANREGYVSVCHQCADQIEDPEVEAVSAELIEEDAEAGTPVEGK